MALPSNGFSEASPIFFMVVKIYTTKVANGMLSKTNNTIQIE